MSRPPQVLECPINEGHKLRVEFFKSNDRYAHRVLAVLVNEAGEEMVVPLAESVEGTEDDLWPPSPPLQSLSMEELADGRTAALLVGMAGGSHWSASVEVDRARGQIVWEFACRTGEPRKYVGCEYEACEGVAMGPADDDGIRFLSPSRRKEWRIMPTKVANSPSCVADAGVSGPVFHIRLTLPESNFPATYRWGYRLTALLA